MRVRVCVRGRVRERELRGYIFSRTASFINGRPLSIHVNVHHLKMEQLSGPTEGFLHDSLPHSSPVTPGLYVTSTRCSGVTTRRQQRMCMLKKYN